MERFGRLTREKYSQPQKADNQAIEYPFYGEGSGAASGTH